MFCIECAKPDLGQLEVFLKEEINFFCFLSKISSDDAYKTLEGQA